MRVLLGQSFGMIGCSVRVVLSGGGSCFEWMMGGGGAADMEARRALLSRRVWKSRRAHILFVLFFSSFVFFATMSNSDGESLMSG